ncbi:hypothetical protein [Rosettibacter firmus]|uniref:flagellin N-terminal helical domain-containing protein n=1 Tax=Rosettibacter firmus TaxID=3111522 RepID=UPI00336BCFB4
MRISDNILTQKYLYNQNKINERKVKVQNQLITNSKIDKLSDDLFNSLEIIKIDSQIRKIETYQKNIDYAKEFVNTTINALENIGNETQKIITQVVNIDNPINSNFKTVAQSVRASLEAIVQNLNTKYNDMYIFGGTNYSNEPWLIDSNGKVINNSTDLTGEVKVQIANGIKDTINVTGDKILNSDLLDTINDIIDSLDAGIAPDKTLKDRLNAAYKEILSIQSLTGEKYNRLEDINTILTKQLQDSQGFLSKRKEIDPAQLAIDLQYQDYLLQLSYKLASSILPKSILDYL